jgi:hypothetical protein
VSRTAVAIGDLSLNFGPRTLIVSRRDLSTLPHLTVCWNNVSGEVDVHLTPEAPRDKNDRDSILKIQALELHAKLRALGNQFLRLLLKNPLRVVWFVQPKWLAERGYFLVGLKGRTFSQHIRSAFPKERGKYRFDRQSMEEVSGARLYKPTFKNFTRLGADGQISAICRKGIERGTRLSLLRLSGDPVEPIWVALNSADLDILLKPMIRLFERWAATVCPGGWKRIREGLQLHDIGL